MNTFNKMCVVRLNKVIVVVAVVVVVVVIVIVRSFSLCLFLFVWDNLAFAPGVWCDVVASSLLTTALQIVFHTQTFLCHIRNWHAK